MRIMGNVSLVKVLVNNFINDSTYSMLKKAFEEKDMDKAEQAAEAMKGMCGNMSVDALFALFTEQLHLLRSREYSKAEHALAEISPAYEQAVAYMKDWLAETL